jgi:hypothetical protein
MADRYPGFDSAAMLAQINATVNRHVTPTTELALGLQRIQETAAAALAPSMSHISAIAAQQLSWVTDAAKGWSRLADEALAEFRRSLPPNLHAFEDVEFSAIETLAGEGITVWAVPRARVAQRLLRAPTSQARRRILADAADDILDDCATIATTAAAGPFPDLARLLEQAIRVTRSREYGAGQALAASILDTLMQVALDDADRKRLVQHKRKATSQVTVMDHFDELEIAAAMVLRPIWFAYRPQETVEQRAASTTFARHGTAHHIRGRQVSKRNAVQAVMLVAALLDLLAVLDRA